MKGNSFSKPALDNNNKNLLTQKLNKMLLGLQVYLH